MTKGSDWNIHHDHDIRVEHLVFEHELQMWLIGGAVQPASRSSARQRQIAKNSYKIATGTSSQCPAQFFHGGGCGFEPR